MVIASVEQQPASKTGHLKQACAMTRRSRLMQASPRPVIQALARNRAGYGRGDGDPCSMQSLRYSNLRPQRRVCVIAVARTELRRPHRRAGSRLAPNPRPRAETWHMRQPTHRSSARARAIRASQPRTCSSTQTTVVATFSPDLANLASNSADAALSLARAERWSVSRINISAGGGATHDRGARPRCSPGHR